MIDFLEDVDYHPTALSFSEALLREILHNLQPTHKMFDKIKYATFLLNFSSSQDFEFKVLYEIYHQVIIFNSRLRIFQHYIVKIC